MIGVYLVGFFCGFAAGYIIGHKDKEGGNHDQD